MNKKYLMMTVLLLASAIVVAGVQGITSLMGNSEEESVAYRQLYEQSIDVKTAVEICQETDTAVTKVFYYVRGEVSYVNISTDYGNATINLTQVDEETGEEYTLQLYRVYYFNGEKFTDTEAINEGDEVIAYGKLVNYRGKTPEMPQGCCIVAVNGRMSESNGEVEPSTPTEPNDSSVIDNTISLQDVPFYRWDGWDANASPIEWAYCEWVTYEPTGVAYGDPNVNNYADLSNYTKLVVTVSEGAPRFLLNRDEDNGQANVKEDDAHLIDNTVAGWSDKYFTSTTGKIEGETVYTVDLAQIVKDKGFAHLHSIKGANWADVKVSSMLVQPKEKVLDTIRIYVNCVIAPYLYTWGTQDIAQWPGIKMTKQEEINGVNFWYMDITTYDYLNIILNDGKGNQTENINNITRTRYYWYDGKTEYEDVTKQVQNGTYQSRDYIMTGLITNPYFRSSFNGWTRTGNPYIDNSIAYSDNSTYDVYQTVTVPTAGLYEVQVQGYSEQDGNEYFYENQRDIPVYLYANGSETPLKSIYEEGINKETLRQWEEEGLYFDYNDYCNDDCLYYPSWTSGARAFFNKGMYSNSVYVYVPTDSAQIRLGVKKVAQNGYTAYWSNFKLFYWGMDAQKAATALSQAIQDANQLQQNNLVTEKGKQLLTAAIAEASALAESEDATAILAAIANLNSVVESVQANYMLIVEEYYIPNNGYNHYYSAGDTINYNKVKLTFHQNNGNQPYSYYSTMYLYNGNSMTFISDMDIVDIQFSNTDYYNIYGVASDGTMQENHWTGSTNELTITNNTGNRQGFGRFIVTFDNPTNEEIAERLSDQVAQAEAAIAALTHENVPGKAELAQKVAEAKVLVAADSLDIAKIKAYTKQLKAEITDLKALDADYTSLDTALTELATAGQDNQYCDAAKQEAATAFIAATQTAIEQGAYKAEDIATIQEKINWHRAQLQMVYLTIALGDPGTLGDEVLMRVTNFTDVQGLRLSGKVDDSDMERIKGQMTNLQEIDLSGIDLKTMPYEQFRNRTMLTRVKLPAGLEAISNYAFYGCTNMESFELPATLKTIGNYAFYNCSKFTELNVPEGVTSIGNNAFQCNTEYSYVYDEYGNYKYDENGNRIRIYNGSNLKKVTLPSTLTNLGSRVFCNCINLEEINIPASLTYINNEVFEGCTALKSITIPANIKMINSEAFYGCGLINIEIAEGLNVISSNAFGNCDSLKAITLPSSVNSVYYPFSDCDNLKSITVKAIAPPYANDNSIMGGDEQQCTLYVPELSLASYKQTDYWSEFAPNIFGLNIMPENIIITDEYRLLWPDTVSFDYKPNMELTKMDRGDNYWGDSRYRYAAVTVTGNATLSAKEFSMYYDYYYKRDYNSDTYSRFATLINNGKIRTDNNILKLHLRADEWNFIALPFDVKVSDIVNVNNTQFVIRGYDVVKRANAKMDSTWYDMKGDDILEAGKGYIWQAAHATTEENNWLSDVEFDVQALQTVNKNNMFRNGTVEIELEENLSEFPQNRSWNFIGNPFPCYFDTRAMDITAPFTVWRDGYNYQAYSPVDDKYILAPGEAFFIQRPLDQASITFLREGRQLNPQVRDITYFAKTRQSEMTTKRSVFNLTIEGQEQNDQTRFVINESALLSYEMDKDASKFMDGAAKGIQLYTIEEGLRYAINERPLAKGEVVLGMKIMKDGSYTIKLDTQADAEVYLVDLLTGETILMGEAGYTFLAKAGSLDNRFIIRLSGTELTGISTVDNAQQQNENYYDLQGRRVEKNQMKNGIYVKKGQKAVVK